VNRRDHSVRTATTKFNRREFKRDKPRIAAQSFSLIVGQYSIGATGKHQQFLFTLIEQFNRVGGELRGVA